MVLFDLSFIRQDIHSGVAKYAYRILDYIVKYKLESNFQLIVNYISKDYISENYPQFTIIVIGNRYQSRIPFFRTVLLSYQFLKVVNKSKSSVVFCPWGNFITLWHNNKKVISVVHDMQTLIDFKGMLYFAYKFMYDMLFKNSDIIVTISEFSKKQISEFYPKVMDHVYNLGNSVALINDDLPGRLFSNDFILYVGRLCEQKNVITLIRAFAIIKDEYPDLKLVVVGGKNNYYEKNVLPEIIKLNIDNRITVISNCSELQLYSLYRDARLFVFPSMREGFGSPPIEAACMCTPVISTKCDSLEEVTMGLLNYYDNPLDEYELSKKIKYLLDNNTDGNQLQNIKEKYINSYSIDVIGKRIVDFIFENSRNS